MTYYMRVSHEDRVLSKSPNLCDSKLPQIIILIFYLIATFLGVRADEKHLHCHKYMRGTFGFLLVTVHSLLAFNNFSQIFLAGLFEIIDSSFFICNIWALSLSDF